MSAVWHDWHCREIGLRILLARRQLLVDWKFANLSAPHWRLYHCAEPGAWITCHGRRVALRPDHLWLAPPDVAFASENDRPITQLYVHFRIIPKWRSPTAGLIPVPINPALTLALALPDPDHDDWQSACAVQTLVLTALARIPSHNFVAEPDDPRARHLIQIMTAEPARPWSNAELGREAGFHPQSLVRWFRQRTGRTPKQFLLELRIQEACLLLLYSEQSLDTIAATTGFCDRYHFSRTFRALRQSSPAAYRRQSKLWPTLRRGNDAIW